MSKFNVGDRVRITDSRGLTEYWVGREYTVIAKPSFATWDTSSGTWLAHGNNRADSQPHDFVWNTEALELANQPVDLTDFRAEYETVVELAGEYRVEIRVTVETEVTEDTMREVLRQAAVGSLVTQYDWLADDIFKE